MMGHGVFPYLTFGKRKRARALLVRQYADEREKNYEKTKKEKGSRQTATFGWGGRRRKSSK